MTPSSSEVHNWLWVLVGDIPSAYLVVDPRSVAMSIVGCTD
jgi:hypothetical protein